MAIFCNKCDVIFVNVLAILIFLIPVALIIDTIRKLAKNIHAHQKLKSGSVVDNTR